MSDQARKVEYTFHERYPVDAVPCNGCHKPTVSGYFADYGDEEPRPLWICGECREADAVYLERRQETRRRAMEQAPRVISREQFFALRPRSVVLNVAGFGEGCQPMLIVQGPEGHELWIPAAMRGSVEFRRHVEWYDGRAKPYVCEEACRFFLGGKACVRVGAHRWTGGLHLALPTGSDALDHVVFYEVEAPGDA